MDTMSVKECRAATCGHYAHKQKYTLRQEQSFGWIKPDGTYDWDTTDASARVSTNQVSDAWRDHLIARYTDEQHVGVWLDGWLVYRTHPHIAELGNVACGRLRWTDTT